MIDPSFVSEDGLAISRATTEDIPTIKSIVDAAYSKYIERIGKPPAPMTADYYQVINTHDVFVLQDPEKRIVGCIVLCLDSESDSIRIDNLVVDPLTQGRGYGRVLMNYAEDIARLQRCSALTLYTNVKMDENFRLYVKMGSAETGSKIEDGFERVYFRRPLT